MARALSLTANQSLLRGHPATWAGCRRPDPARLCAPRWHRACSRPWRSARPRWSRRRSGGVAPACWFLASGTRPTPLRMDIGPRSGGFPSSVGGCGSPPRLLPPRSPRGAHASPARRRMPPARTGCDTCGCLSTVTHSSARGRDAGAAVHGLHVDATWTVSAAASMAMIGVTVTLLRAAGQPHGGRPEPHANTLRESHDSRRGARAG